MAPLRNIKAAQMLKRRVCAEFKKIATQAQKIADDPNSFAVIEDVKADTLACSRRPDATVIAASYLKESDNKLQLAVQIHAKELVYPITSDADLNQIAISTVRYHLRQLFDSGVPYVLLSAVYAQERTQTQEKIIPINDLPC